MQTTTVEQNERINKMAAEIVAEVFPEENLLEPQQLQLPESQLFRARQWQD